MATDAELLAAVDAALAGNTDGARRVRTADGREVEHFSPAELMQMKTALEARIARTNRGGMMGGVAFGRPT